MSDTPAHASLAATMPYRGAITALGETGRDIVDAPMPQPSSLSDRLLLVSVAAAPALAYLAAFTLDTRRTFVNSSYATVVVTEGRAVVAAQVLSMTISGTLAAHVFLRGLLSGRQPLTWLAIPGVLLTGFTFLRGDAELGNLLGLVVGIAVLLAASVTRIDRAALSWLGIYALAYVASVWVVAIVMPQESITECRPDKCGLGGGLLQSYMSHEQVLGLYVAFLVPALAFLPRSVFVLGLLAHVVTVAATGSRTAALTVAVTALIAFVLHRRRRVGVASNWRIMPLMVIVPAAATATALGMFLLVRATSLTDRGAVWEVVRTELTGTGLVTGPGAGIFTTAFERSATTWLIPHAHNQVAHLLVEGGLLALSAFVVGIVTLTVAGLLSQDTRMVAFAVGPSLSFGTEIVWSYNFLSSFMWTLFITVALMSAHLRGRS